MEVVRRKLEAAYAEGRLRDARGFDRDKSWNAVFLAAANDNEFWTTEVAETAVMHLARVKEKDDLTDPGHQSRLRVPHRAAVEGVGAVVLHRSRLLLPTLSGSGGQESYEGYDKFIVTTGTMGGNESKGDKGGGKGKAWNRVVLHAVSQPTGASVRSLLCERPQGVPGLQGLDLGADGCVSSGSSQRRIGRTS